MWLFILIRKGATILRGTKESSVLKQSALRAETRTAYVSSFLRGLGIFLGQANRESSLS